MKTVSAEQIWSCYRRKARLDFCQKDFCKALSEGLFVHFTIILHHTFLCQEVEVRTESVQMSGAAVSSNPYNSGGDAKYYTIYTNIHI